MLMAEQEPYALMVSLDDMLISPREVRQLRDNGMLPPPLCPGRPPQLY